MVRLLIVANVRLYRDWLSDQLSHVPGIEVVGAASSRNQVRAQLANGADIILLDMATPQSAAIIEDTHSAFPTAQIVAVGLPEVEEVIISCAEAGIAGYLPLEGSTDDLAMLIQSVARGETLVSPKIAAGLLRRVSALAARQMEVDGVHRLTPRELQVAALLEDGVSNKGICRRLNISLPTVKNHVHSILEKLQIHRRAQVAARLRAERRAPYRLQGEKAP